MSMSGIYRRGIRLGVEGSDQVLRELERVGEQGERSLRRIELAGQPASLGLRTLNVTAEAGRGLLEGMASGAGIASTALAGMGVGGLAASAGLAVLSATLQAGAAEAEEQAQAQRRLEAVLRTTGNASGLTAQQLADLADQMEESTLATAEGIKQAEAVLLTFRSVSGETFTRAIRLAQDMAAVFGGDASRAAVQLGKALESPSTGLGGLKEAGVDFSAAQRELILDFDRTGRSAEAQRVILDALQRQVAGAGAAEAGGLTGATRSLSAAWGDMLKQLNDTTGYADRAVQGLDLATAAIKATGEALRAPTSAEQLAVLLAERERIAPSGILGDIDDRIARLQELSLGDAMAESRNQAIADAGPRVAQWERVRDLLASEGTTLSKALAAVTTDAPSRIKAVNDELAVTRARLEALRSRGADSATVDAELAKAEEIARRRIETIERPGRELAERQADQARRALEQNQKVVDDLARQYRTVDDERAAFIEQAVSRLSSTATDEQIAKTRELATALYDERQEREYRAEEMAREQDVMREGEDVREALLTSEQRLAEQRARYDDLLRQGAISLGVYQQALADLSEEERQAYSERLQASREWRDGVTRALIDYQDQASDSASIAERAIRDTASGAEDAIGSLVAALARGEASWEGLASSARDAAASVLAEMARIAAQRAVIGPALGLLEGLLGGSAAISGGAGSDSLAGLDWTGIGAAGSGMTVTLHQGGMVGSSASVQRLLEAMGTRMSDWPRYHTGGWPGLRDDEVPAILQRGERVLSRDEVARGGGEPAITISIDARGAADPNIDRKIHDAVVKGLQAYQDQRRRAPRSRRV